MQFSKFIALCSKNKKKNPLSISRFLKTPKKSQVQTLHHMSVLYLVMVPFGFNIRLKIQNKVLINGFVFLNVSAFIYQIFCS